MACGLQGCATIGIAVASTIKTTRFSVSQRLLLGFHPTAIANHVGQSTIESLPRPRSKAYLGRAFGFVGLMQKGAAIVAVAAIVSWQGYWRRH